MFPPLHCQLKPFCQLYKCKLFFLHLAPSLLCRDIDSFYHVFCWSLFLPLMVPATVPNESLHQCSGLVLWQWMMNRINNGQGANTAMKVFCHKSEDPLFLFLSVHQDQVSVSASPVVSPLQSAPWESSTQALMLKKLLLMRWYENPTYTHTHRIVNTLGKLSLCVTHTSWSVSLCVCVITNPWFYLCLMPSAVGRHTVQGQLLLLPLTCMLCVFMDVCVCVCV